MVSPYSEIDKIKNYSLFKLYQIKEELLKELKEYEDKYICEQNIKFKIEDIIFSSVSEEDEYIQNRCKFLPLLQKLILKKQKEIGIWLNIEKNMAVFFSTQKTNYKVDDDIEEYWCETDIHIKSDNVKIHKMGYFLTDEEVLYLIEDLEIFLSLKNDKEYNMTFLEQDISFRFIKSEYIEMKFNVYYDSKVSHKIELDRENVLLLYTYLIRKFKKEESYNNILDEINNDEQKYIYLKVKYDYKNSTKTYYYKTDNDNINVYDKVIVDMSEKNTIATVIEKEYYTSSNVPYPLCNTKNVITKITENTNLEEYDIITKTDSILYNKYNYHLDETNSETVNILRKSFSKYIDITILIGSMKRIDSDNKLEIYYNKKLNIFIEKQNNKFRIVELNIISAFVDNDNLLCKILEESILLNKYIDINIINKNKYLKITDNNDVLRAINFCDLNNIKWDTDIIFPNKRNKNKLKNKVYNEEKRSIKNIDEVIKKLKNYKGIKMKIPNTEYDENLNQLIYSLPYYNYEDTIIDLPKFLLDNHYIVDIYNGKYNLEGFPEEFENFNFDTDNILELSYYIFRIYSIERIFTGFLNSCLENKKLFKLIKRIKEVNVINKKENLSLK